MSSTEPEPVNAHAPAETPGEHQAGKEGRLDRDVPKLRYVFVLPIIASYVASVVLLVLGFYETFTVIFDAIGHSEGHALETLRLHFIELIDVFLLATILYVIAGGFYQLFLGRVLNLAPWMRVDSVHDLEVLLIGVIVTVLGVAGLARVLSWDGRADLWQLGVTVALVIAALGYFRSRSGDH